MTQESEGLLETVREELRLWPYTIHQIDDTLDSSLIEGRGKQLLFQALNSGMLTAFVGSGVSGAYGRMSWSEWQSTQVDLVKDLSKKFLKLAKASDALMRTLIDQLEQSTRNDDERETRKHAHRRLTERWLRQRQRLITQAKWEVEHLSNTFKGATSPHGEFPGGEDLPVKFEIAKKLHDLLLRHRGLFLWPQEKYEDWNKKKRSEKKKFTLYSGSRVDPMEGAPEPELKAVAEEYCDWGKKELPLPKNELRAFKTELDSYLSLAKRPEARISFETYAKTLLVDEAAHAEALILEGLRGGKQKGRTKINTQKLRKKLNIIDRSSLRRDIEGIRDQPDRFRVLSYFTIAKAVKLLDQHVDCCPGWGQLLGNVAGKLRTYDQDKSALKASRHFLTPSSRFIVPMILELLERPLPALEALEKAKFGLGELGADDYKSRRSIIADRFDPLDKAISKLKINRFLTTNYDFEIERQYLDRGFRRFDTQLASPWRETKEHALNPKSYRTDGLGAVMRDMTFSAETATDLLTFSAGGDGADASIFHLHGRATKHDKIVVTERDYMNMYLRQDPDRDVVDESILMAFAATPILFLGLGMNEADLLRPLRQFISDEDRAIGYRAIVLLPATANYDSRTKTAAGLYMRYGAHTIFFGGGYVQVRDSDDKLINQPLDWLHRVMALIGALMKAVKGRRGQVRKFRSKDNKHQLFVTHDALTDLDTLVEALGKLGPDLARRGEAEQETDAFPLLMGCDPTRDWRANPDTLRIQNCFFTPKRGGWDSSDQDAQINDGAVYTEFYISMLTDLMQMAIKPQQWRSLNEALRSLTAMLQALDGVKSALMTATFNASLDGIEKEWRLWWADWQESPGQREAMFEELPPYRAPKNKGSTGGDTEDADAIDQSTYRNDVILPRRLVRHRVISVITNLIHCLENMAGPIAVDHKKQLAFRNASDLTGVRVFDTFIYDIAATAEERLPSYGRLMHSVAAARGQGKGAFFSVFNTPLGITSYLRAAHPGTGLDSDGPFIMTACFINLSFAAEIASVYEMLEEMLLETVAQLTALTELSPADYDASCMRPPARVFEAVTGAIPVDSVFMGADEKDFFKKVGSSKEQAIKNLRRKLDSLTRADRFRSLMHKFAQGSDAFATANCLGLRIRPRLMICINAVELLFDLDRRPKNLEISDLLNWLMSVKASKIPFDFIVIGDHAKIGRPLTRKTHIKRLIVSRPKQLEKVRQSIERSGTLLGLRARPDAFQCDPATTNFIHAARPIEPRDFLVDNFLPLACALYVGRLKRQKDEAALSLDADAEFNKFTARRRCKLNSHRRFKWQQPNVPDVNELYFRSRNAFEELVARSLVGQVPIDLVKKSNQEVRVQMVEALRRSFGTSEAGTTHRISDQDQADWDSLQQVLGGNRFCLTILLAAAQHLVFANKSFIEGGVEADTLLKGVVTRVRNASVSKTEEVVLETVMGVYRTTTRIGCADLDHELHMLLLRNIAVMGCPLSPNVIVRLPDMRDYFNKVKMNDQLSRRRTVARALAVLSERGLAFRLSPHPKLLRLESKLKKIVAQYSDAIETKDTSAEFEKYIRKQGDGLFDAYKAFQHWPAEREFRYALHRQVQAYCFKRLGHLSTSQISANTFAPTLYASMPSRVVRLSAEGYLFLRRLMLGLSQYPDIRQEDAARDRPIFNDDNVITRVQALRAALSMVRGTFSIAAVSRFTDETTGLEFTKKRGYFETYKVRLRWILRKAWEIHHPVQPDASHAYRVNSLYQDEIVWLYNEVAVTCLVQGNLIDGIGHGRQALFLNKKIEGDKPGGRMHNMISLNIAIMQIDRGRLLGAYRRLSEIIATEEPQHRRVYYLAKGYQALITHLQGNREDATVGFLEAIKGLSYGEEDRARAIFANHHAHLIAQTDIGAAEKEITRAREYAESGGHEDIRSRIVVSEVWLKQLISKDYLTDAAKDRGKLDKIQEYARMMGLDSLLVDTLHVQARMLLLAGDSSSSGRLMARAMAIARRNSMNLRLNSLMTSYARVLGNRGRVDASRRLLDASLTMAKHHQFGLEVIRINDAYQAI